jgi:hypothetical protein
MRLHEFRPSTGVAATQEPLTNEQVFDLTRIIVAAIVVLASTIVTVPSA